MFLRVVSSRFLDEGQNFFRGLESFKYHIEASEILNPIPIDPSWDFLHPIRSCQPGGRLYRDLLGEARNLGILGFTHSIPNQFWMLLAENDDKRIVINLYFALFAEISPIPLTKHKPVPKFTKFSISADFSQNHGLLASCAPDRRRNRKKGKVQVKSNPFIVILS